MVEKLTRAVVWRHVGGGAKIVGRTPRLAEVKGEDWRVLILDMVVVGKVVEKKEEGEE